MSFGDTPCIIAGGGRYKIAQIAERLDFHKDEEGPFMVLHFDVNGRAARLRVPITQADYEKYRENSN